MTEAERLKARIAALEKMLAELERTMAIAERHQRLGKANGKAEHKQ